jgi:general secretion pathway protein G
VLAILVVLASIVVPMVTGTQERALQDAAKGEIGIIKRAVDLYKFHTKSYPSNLVDLVKKPNDSKLAERWAGPYFEGSKAPTDPWENEYRFTSPGKHNPDTFDLWSTGPDGQDGSADDIGNWES